MESGRKGVCLFFRKGKMIEFDEFVLGAELIDIPLRDMRFTWSNLDGSTMSRIDRFLFSESWLHIGGSVISGV